MPTDKTTHTPGELRHERHGRGAIFFESAEALANTIRVADFSAQSAREMDTVNKYIRLFSAAPALLAAAEAAIGVHTTAFPTGELRNAAEESVAQQLRAAIKLARGE